MLYGSKSLLPKVDLEKVEAPKSRIRDFPRRVVFWCCFLILVLVFTIDTTVSLSCQTNSLCIPVMLMKFTGFSGKSKWLLYNVREGLEIAANMAKDFGVQSEGDYLSSINTFSQDNTFYFNSNGFCREDPSVSYCVSANGLSIVTCLVYDIGVQLGNISSYLDAKKAGESFSKTFRHFVDLLNTLYTESSKHRTEGVNLEKLKMAKTLKTMETFGSMMSVGPFITIPLSVTSIIIGLAALKSNVWSILLSLVIGHLAVQLARVVTAEVFRSLIVAHLKDLDIVLLHLATGQYLLLTTVVLDALVCSGLGFILIHSKI